MSSLSENTIKQIALGYLKSFYRLRPRAFNTATLTGTDMRGSNNIIADGFLHFTEEDGNVFTATFEASSQATKDEICYRPRLSHVLWDSMAFACLFLPTFLAIAHIANWYPLAAEDFYLRLLYLLLSLPLWMSIYFVAFRRLPRYRYIFAIEQFKQYKANDQWIAFGYDAFSGMKGKYRRELIRQCSRFGFGLVEINAQRLPKLIMAPSRAEIFVPARSVFDFLPHGEWQKRLQSMTLGPWAKVKKALRERLLPVQNRYFRWFPRMYYNQWALVLLGLLITSILIKIEHQKLPTFFPNEKRYRKEVIAENKGERREPEYFVVDAPIAGFYDSTFTPYEMRFNEEQFSGMIQAEETDDSRDVAAPPLRILSANPGEEVALYYSCDRYNNLHTTFYLLADSVYSQLAGARNRLSELNDLGLSATAVWPPCLGGTGKGFLVYVDELLIDSTGATQLLDSLQQQLDSTDRQLRLLKFHPITNQ